MGANEFHELLLSQQDLLGAIAMRLTKNTELAKDLCQETLCKALANREKFEPGTNMKAWLSTIMRNVFLNDRRKSKNKRVADVFLRHHFQLETGTPSENKVVHGEIRTAIYKLSPNLKRSLELYLAGYKYEEVALAIQKPVGTVKSHIHLARKQLRVELN